jgi:hypothetical protein
MEAAEKFVWILLEHLRKPVQTIISGKGNGRIGWEGPTFHLLVPLSLDGNYYLIGTIAKIGLNMILSRNDCGEIEHYLVSSVKLATWWRRSNPALIAICVKKCDVQQNLAKPPVGQDGPMWGVKRASRSLCCVPSVT